MLANTSLPAPCERGGRRRSSAQAPPTAHYRFPHPLKHGEGVRLTGSKSKKVIRLWQAEVAGQEAQRVGDELRLLLHCHHPAGLSLDLVWPEVRKMVRSRPGAYTPVVGGFLDKPDRTMCRILETAGFASLRAFLATLPEVELEGDGPRAVARLSAAYVATQPSPPVQPTPATGPAAPVVLRRARVRDLSAQVLGLPVAAPGDLAGGWRELASEAGVKRSEAAAAARKLLEEHRASLAAAAAARAAAAAAAAAAGEEEKKETGTRQKKKRKDIFPEWRRARPPLHPGGPTVYVSGGAAEQRRARAAALGIPMRPQRVAPPTQPRRSAPSAAQLRLDMEDELDD